jgi:hypothetical protein
VIRPGGDPDAVAVQFEDAVARLSSQGATVVVFTGIDTEFTPVFRGIRGRVAIYNENIRAIADRYDCIVADQWALKEVQDARFFDDDRLHYNPLGHHEIARMVLRALNVPNDLQPMQPDPLPQLTWREARTNDLVWARTHLVPWVLRRLRHQSSGDHVTAKRPSRCPVTVRPRPATAPRAPVGRLQRRAQSATAAAEATLSESTPPAIGIVTTVSAAASARRDSPSPSAPRAARPAADARRRTRRGRPRRRRARGRPGGARHRAAGRGAPQPPSASSGRRVHGTWKTVPMLPHAPTVEGSAQRCVTSTASAPSRRRRGTPPRRWCGRRCPQDEHQARAGDDLPTGGSAAGASPRALRGARRSR